MPYEERRIVLDLRFLETTRGDTTFCANILLQLFFFLDARRAVVLLQGESVLDVTRLVLAVNASEMLLEVNVTSVNQEQQICKLVIPTAAVEVTIIIKSGSH